MAYLVQGQLGLHEQLALRPHRPLLEEVADLVGTVQEVAVPVLLGLRVGGGEDCTGALVGHVLDETLSLALQEVHLVGGEEVVDYDVAVGIQLGVEEEVCDGAFLEVTKQRFPH